MKFNILRCVTVTLIFMVCNYSYAGKHSKFNEDQEHECSGKSSNNINRRSNKLTEEEMNYVREEYSKSKKNQRNHLEKSNKAKIPIKKEERITPGFSDLIKKLLKKNNGSEEINQTVNKNGIKKEKVENPK